MSTLSTYFEKKDSFKKDTPLDWKCRNCGFIRSGIDAPRMCPVCSHPHVYFEKTDEN